MSLLKKILLVLFLAFLLCHHSSGQVIISPEIGISYQPFKVSSSLPDTEISSNRIDLLIGLSVQIPLNKKWLIRTKVSYSKRESVKWRQCGIEYCDILMYKHSDLNIDIGFQYRISKRINIGLGPSLITKINSVFSRTHDSYFIPAPMPLAMLYPQKYYKIGISGMVSFDLKYFIVNLEHLRRLSKEESLTRWGDELIAKSRTNLTIAVPMFSGRYKRS